MLFHLFNRTAHSLSGIYGSVTAEKKTGRKLVCSRVFESQSKNNEGITIFGIPADSSAVRLLNGAEDNEEF